MKCPVCSTSDLLMSERAGVEIDYCPQCRGVWLDRGELDKIIARSVQEQPPQERIAPGASLHPRTYEDHQGHGHHYQSNQHSRKKSFWQEIFD